MCLGPGEGPIASLNSFRVSFEKERGHQIIVLFLFNGVVFSVGTR